MALVAELYGVVASSGGDAAWSSPVPLAEVLRTRELAVKGPGR